MKRSNNARRLSPEDSFDATSAFRSTASQPQQSSTSTPAHARCILKSISSRLNSDRFDRSGCFRFDRSLDFDLIDD